ncbi:MAG: AMP-binding protein, partial [Proteobacteria bacterium]|nr:AMP-binding protein [Pseudomonadota bacterium]
VRVDGSVVTKDRIRGGLKSRIAAYKIPKYIRLTEEPLMRGATEKFDKRAIRRAFIDQMP